MSVYMSTKLRFSFSHPAAHTVCVISSAFLKIGPSIIRSTWLPSELSISLVSAQIYTQCAQSMAGPDPIMYHIFCPIDNYYCSMGEALYFYVWAAVAALCVSLLAACAHSPNYQTHINNGPHPYMDALMNANGTCAAAPLVLLLYISICSHLRSIVQSIRSLARSQPCKMKGAHRADAYCIMCVVVLLGRSKSRSRSTFQRKGSLLELQIESRFAFSCCAWDKSLLRVQIAQWHKILIQNQKAANFLAKKIFIKVNSDLIM